MTKVNMTFYSCKSNHNINRLLRNSIRSFLKRIIFSVLVAAIISIGLLSVFVYSSKIENNRHIPKRDESIRVNSFSTFTKDDLQLNNTLIYRAKNRSNRYYLNDFAYFRMIQNEFPRTESAARIGRGSGLLPLLPTTPNSQDVLFIVMGSVAKIKRSKLLVETWLQWSQGNFFIFADANDSSVPFTTLPQLVNKSRYIDAQHRQLVGSQWLIHNKSELVKRTKWFVFVDDDTWVNVPALLSYLQFFDHRLLLSIGYIWDGLESMPGWSYFSGGAGIVFSQPAFVTTMSAIYTSECPFHGTNDVTIIRCYKKKGVTKIYSDRFYYSPPPDFRSVIYVPEKRYVSQITFHYVSDVTLVKRMTCDVAAYWKWPISGCNKLDPNSSFHLEN